MKNLIPVTRETLLTLKNVTDFERRMKMIDNIVTDIYKSVIKTAKYSENKKMNYKIPTTESIYTTDKYYDTFYIKNMDNILREVRELFPESRVEQVFIVPDGTYEETGEMHIVIDWSTS